MIFNSHSELVGRHAPMSASVNSWLGYDEDKFIQFMMSREAAARGSRLHNLAHLLIQEGVKLPRTPKTLNMYVNDCIGWKMKTEQLLVASPNAFGTADAIDYKPGRADRPSVLRISDLKTGTNEAKPAQLEVYAAFFCMEYLIKPFEIDRIELRIYQNDQVVEYLADPLDITMIIQKIIAFDKIISQLRKEASL